MRGFIPNFKWFSLRKYTEIKKISKEADSSKSKSTGDKTKTLRNYQEEQKRY